MATAGAVPCERARQIRAEGYGAERRGLIFGHRLQRAVEPAVVGGFHAGRAGLHEILRVEMRARGIGRADGLHDGELAVLEKRCSGCRLGCRPKNPSRSMAASAPPRRGSGIAMVGRKAIVVRLGERHDDVQAVHRAALEEHDHLFLVRRGGGGHGALQERRQAKPCPAWRCRRFSGNIAARWSYLHSCDVASVSN